MFGAPAYDAAYTAIYREVLDAFVASDAILGDFRRVVSRHFGPMRNVRGEKPLDQPPAKASITSTLKTDDILETNIEAHDQMLFESGQDAVAAQTTEFFRGMAQITDAVGTTVKNVGQGAPTIEQLREVLKKMDLEFTEQGTLSSNLRLYVDPAMKEKAAALNAAAAADPEIQAILLEKRRIWMERRAQKRDRKLS